jgi:hypothetical protein
MNVLQRARAKARGDERGVGFSAAVADLAEVAVQT